MASKPLTAKFVEAAKPGNSRIEIPDGASPGLFLIVQPSGSKSWALRYRNGTRTRKLTLGGYPALQLADARKKALEALRIAAEGMDPAIEAAQAKAEHRSDESLVENVLADFVKRHVSQNKESTSSEVIRMIDRHLLGKRKKGDMAPSLPSWQGRRIKTIGKRDVIAVLDAAIDADAPYLANRLFAMMRRFMNWCVGRGIIDTSPMIGMRAPTEEKARDRKLSDDEVQYFWQACNQVGWPWGPFGKLLLLTGQRREEVAGVAWAEFDLSEDNPTWLIPRERAKNGNENLVALSPIAVQILTELKALAGNYKHVFTTTGTTPISGFSKGKSRITEKMLSIMRQEDADAS